MVEWLHTIPAPVGAVLVILLFLIPTLFGSAYLQPLIGGLLRHERDQNLPVGMLLNTFTLYYAVLLALLSIAVLENRNRAKEAVGHEATALVALYRDIRGYPEPGRSQLIAKLQKYVDEETGPGWKTQRLGRTASSGSRLVDDINTLLTTLQPQSDSGGEALQANTLHGFDRWVELRRARIQAGDTHIPPILWYVLVIGAIVNVVVLWLLDLARISHLIISGILVSFIALVVYMVADLDRPFRGRTGIGPDELVQARAQLRPYNSQQRNP